MYNPDTARYVATTIGRTLAIQARRYNMEIPPIDLEDIGSITQDAVASDIYDGLEFGLALETEDKNLGHNQS